MRNSAITRIIIYSIVIFLLVGILLAGIGLGMFTFRISSGSGTVVTNEITLPSDQVQNLDIDWASGSITIEPAAVDTISFRESGDIDSGEEMRYSLHNGTLKLDYSGSTVQIGFVSMPIKDLIITVPENWTCQELEIDAASADATIRGLTIGSVDLDSASNDLTFLDCSIQTLNMDGASNKLHLEGTLHELDSDGMSNEMTLVLRSVPDKLNLDGMSSQLDLTLPLGSGYRVQMDGMSNHFSSEFDTLSQNGTYLYGDGHCSIVVNGMSSNVIIRKGQ